MEKIKLYSQLQKENSGVIQNIFQGFHQELLDSLVTSGVSLISLGNNHLCRLYFALTVVKTWSVHVM